MLSTYSSRVYVAVNGYLSLNDDKGEYVNYELPDSSLSDTVILPYYDDLLIEQPSRLGVYYEVYSIDGGISRQVTFEWVVTSYYDRTQYLHFSTTLYEAYPGVVNSSYHTTTAKGGSATVGAQALSVSKYIQWAYNSFGSVPDETYLVLDTRVGSGTAVQKPLALSYTC